jgi:hypothetical protein
MSRELRDMGARLVSMSGKLRKAGLDSSRRAEKALWEVGSLMSELDQTWHMEAPLCELMERGSVYYDKGALR